MVGRSIDAMTGPLRPFAKPSGVVLLSKVLVGEDVGPTLTATVIRRALPLLARIPSCRRGRYGGNDDEHDAIFNPMPRFTRHSDERPVLIVVAWRLCQNSLLP